jgi:hypothetical protein
MHLRLHTEHKSIKWAYTWLKTISFPHKKGEAA